MEKKNTTNGKLLDAEVFKKAYKQAEISLLSQTLISNLQHFTDDDIDELLSSLVREATSRGMIDREL